MATTSSLSPTAELFQQIGYMANDDAKVRRVLRYAKRVNRESNPAEKMVLPRQAFEDIKESLKDIKETGGASFMSWEQLKKEMHDEGYFH